MTERRANALKRDATTLTIGPSDLHWDGNALTIRIDEVTAPLPSRIRGTVRLTPNAIVARSFALDPRARHLWRPIAPRAHVEVALQSPDLAWSGEGYLDTNAGSEPLEDGFAQWHWSRAHLKNDTAVLYDGTRSDGSTFGMALRIDASGAARVVEAPPVVALPTSGWRMQRATRADAGPGIAEDDRARVHKTWEDSPFYVRTALTTRLFGERCEAVHESLSLDRFRAPWVRFMLPFRMPRRFI
jgi:carotenoid 1,2-hydratase